MKKKDAQKKVNILTVIFFMVFLLSHPFCDAILWTLIIYGGLAYFSGVFDTKILGSDLLWIKNGLCGWDFGKNGILNQQT